MLSGWPIRNKLWLGITLLFVSVAILAFSCFRGVYAFRGLARGVSSRAQELPTAVALAQATAALEETVRPFANSSEKDADTLLANEGHASQITQITDSIILEAVKTHIQTIHSKLQTYQEGLERNHVDDGHIGDIGDELAKAKEIRKKLIELEQLTKKLDESTQSDLWTMSDSKQRQDLVDSVDHINELAAELPAYLNTRMNAFVVDVRGQYRTWIVLAWVSTISSTMLLGLILRLFYGWVFKPLKQLIEGSRRVATGNFGYRIRLKTNDEIAELAGSMNNMTQRFQEIRDDLDRQVRERTKEVVRSEQLASVGFLAAGVAHEINNPLASIALCAESLEERLLEFVGKEEADDGSGEQPTNSDAEVVRDYLKMIQDEAFRCKEITEQLLDYSRMGDVEKNATDLTDLVQSVIDMVRHVGKYKEKQVELTRTDPVLVELNPQEIKQVVLNLITNGMDSLDPGGKVSVNVRGTASHAELIVTDNGCGMSDEVKKHIFEPFFTRRRDGQGTGLGMSISYRIVTDHGGSIHVSSAGIGQGSQFTVRLPLLSKEEEYDDARHKAA